ncbi:hypothetical protein [Streptomyces sp. NPDC006368]|uniref:hypothetical protein n=1 Tax=Streptomyces sp. NPDC006368 TaxID=3156760 RepID=UPI0033A740C7
MDVEGSGDGDGVLPVQAQGGDGRVHAPSVLPKFAGVPAGGRGDLAYGCAAFGPEGCGGGGHRLTYQVVEVARVA